METSVDPRIRPSLTDLASRRAAEEGEARPAGPGGDPAERTSRKAFADYRNTGTDEVTTLGPDREIKTVEAPLRFGDLVDLVNPLQHIPVVSSLYRTITGDEISPAARILGSMIYTGPLGFVYATADSLFAEISGRPFGDTLVSAVFGGGQSDQSEPSDLAGPSAPAGPDIADGSEPLDEPRRADRPAPATETLTGNAALQALAADLNLFAHSTSNGRREADAAEPARSGKSGLGQGERTLQSGPEPRSVAAITPPAGPASSLPVSGKSPELSDTFARKMMEALDKYRSAAEARRLEEERSQGSPRPPAEIR